MGDNSASWSRVVRNTKSTDDTNERYTPTWLLDLIGDVLNGIDLDPAADPQKRVNAKRHFTKQDDGLDKGWSGKVFLNPPFSNSSDWIKHFCIYFHSGAISEAIIILPVMALSNKSASLLMRNTATAFTLLGRKLSFLDSEYNDIGEMSAFPFALVYCGNDTDNFLNKTDQYGVGCLIRSSPTNSKLSFCSYCGKTFQAKRSTAKFCCSTCRSASNRKVHAAANSL